MTAPMISYAILDELMTADGETNEKTLRECIARVTSDYEEKIGGARRRLNTALEIIVIAYYASVIKSGSDAMVDRLMQA